MDIKKIYINTIKFASQFEHTEQDILRILTETGFIKKVWGINLSNRGKYVEIKCNSQNDCNTLIQQGIFDSQYNTTYIVEPAYDANKTQITAFNVPLSAAGTSIEQYLEDSHLKVLAHERQIAKSGEYTVYTGVIKYKCVKLDGFTNLPQYKTFYNNRRIGFRHPEQYEEQNKAEADRREQKEKEQENAARNRKEKEDRRVHEEIRRELEEDMKASKQREKSSIAILKQLMSPNTDEAKAKELYLRNRDLHKMDEVPPKRAVRREDEGVRQGIEIDMEINVGETETIVTHPEVTEEVQDLSKQIVEESVEPIVVVPQEESQVITEEYTELAVTQLEKELSHATSLQPTPKMEEIQKDQIRIAEEIKEKDEELRIQKEIALDKTEAIDGKVEELVNFLDTKEEELRKEKEANEKLGKLEKREEGGESHTAARSRSNSIEGGIKETRIISKPNRSQSIVSTHTEFVAPENIDPLTLDEPEEGEILTPSLCANFLKRNKSQTTISTDEEVRRDEKRRSSKETEEPEMHQLRMGDFRRIFNMGDFNHLKNRIETDRLTLGDTEEIMLYLMLHKGDTSGLRIRKDADRAEFIAYTCFLTAGSWHNLKQRDPKNMWEPSVHHAWQNISDIYKHKESSYVNKKYKQILNNINKR